MEKQLTACPDVRRGIQAFLLQAGLLYLIQDWEEVVYPTSEIDYNQKDVLILLHYPFS